MQTHDDNMEAFKANWPLFKNRLVVLLGAGASIGAKNKQGQSLLNAYELRNDLWVSFKQHKETHPFDPADLKLMSLEHAAAIIEARTGRAALREHLVRLFSCDHPMWHHLVLPYLKPQSMFTTNYDELVELGYKSHTDQIDVICSDLKPMNDRIPLYKPHGSLSRANQQIGQGGLVITQFDYLEMIANYRSMLVQSMTGFDSTCVLFIGYSFGDMDITAELYRLRSKNRDIPWYAIFPRNDPQVKQMYSTRLGIQQINRTFSEFLRELDEHANFIPDQFKFSNIESLRTQSLIQ